MPGRPGSRHDFIPSTWTRQQVISVITSSPLVEGANQCNQLLYYLVGMKFWKNVGTLCKIGGHSYCRWSHLVRTCPILEAQSWSAAAVIDVIHSSFGQISLSMMTKLHVMDIIHPCLFSLITWYWNQGWLLYEYRSDKKIHTSTLSLFCIESVKSTNCRAVPKFHLYSFISKKWPRIICGVGESYTDTGPSRWVGEIGTPA